MPYIGGFVAKKNQDKQNIRPKYPFLVAINNRYYRVSYIYTVILVLKVNFRCFLFILYLPNIPPSRSMFYLIGALAFDIYVEGQNQ